MFNFKKNKSKKLNQSIIDGHYKVAINLLNKGANPNYRFKYDDINPIRSINCKATKETEDSFPLINAIINAVHTDIDFPILKNVIQLMIDKGADVNARTCSGQTSLFIAITFGQLQIAKLLVSNNADLNIKDNILGNSPLHVAVSMGNIKTIEFLINNGADLNIQNMKGDTPIIFAIFFGYIEIVKLLLDAGSNVNIKNNNNKTALDAVILTGNEHIISIFEDAKLINS